MRDEVHVLRLPDSIRGACEVTFDGWPDDVVVDFPSMASVVDRMQAAFFGRARDVHRVAAEVELTSKQADAGGRVPLNIPLRRLCLACTGRGEVSDQSCGVCGGAGDCVTVESVHVFVPSGVRDGMRFEFRVRVPAALQTAVDVHVRVR